ISMFYAVVATLPIWAARAPLRLALIAAPAALLILANAASVDGTAAAGRFGPSFGPSLSEPITFLEQHGLTHGYAAYDDAAPMSFKTDFALRVYADDVAAHMGTPRRFTRSLF